MIWTEKSLYKLLRILHDKLVSFLWEIKSASVICWDPCNLVISIIYVNETSKEVYVFMHFSCFSIRQRKRLLWSGLEIEIIKNYLPKVSLCLAYIRETFENCVEKKHCLQKFFEKSQLCRKKDFDCQWEVNNCIINCNKGEYFVYSIFWKISLSLIIVATHNSHIFVRPKKVWLFCEEKMVTL